MDQHSVLALKDGVRYHRRIATRGPKSKFEVCAVFVNIRANGLFFLWFLWFFKDYKPEVPSHNSFESQLCGTLKNPHAIRKEKGTEFGAVLWFVLEIQGHCRDLGFVSFFLSRRAMVILKV